MPVTPQFIMQGAIYALEQCGLLLRDANVFYEGGSYASAVVLTAFAREELGRYRILLDFWREASAGKNFTIEELGKACDDHVTKQRAGMRSLTLRADKDSRLGKILEARIKNHPQSAEWKKADEELKQIDETQKKRIPGARHQKRMEALYVEPLSKHAWNRPAVTSQKTAYEFLVDAMNDYTGPYQQGYITPAGLLKDIDPELHKALDQWSARPALPPPESPKYPG